MSATVTQASGLSQSVGDLPRSFSRILDSHPPTSRSVWLQSSFHTQGFLTSFFPSLLEDLGLTGYNDPQFNGDPHGPQTVIPSTSPPPTGSLHFHLRGRVGRVARQLLDLPNGLHFKSLTLSWDHKADLWWITELVTRCSHGLEFLEIFHTFHRTSIHIIIRTKKLM